VQLQDCPWRSEVGPPEIYRVPTMLSVEERTLLYVLARDFAGDGGIVDGGCFLGGSTVPLLAGVRDRKTPGPPVVSYDRFRVEAYTIPPFFADEPEIRVGESFRPSFDRNVAGLGVAHEVCEGDVIEHGWRGGPIGVLFLDLVKSWKINDAVLRDFFTELRPGSVIVQQDYGWGAGPWIHITMELLSDSVTLVDGMKAGSHVFVVDRPLDRGLLERGVRGLSYPEQLQLIDRAIDRLDGWARGMVQLARARVVANGDGRAAALAEVEAVAAANDDPYVQLCVEYGLDLLSDPDSAAVRHAQRAVGD
jgi:hypothetical protein